MNTLAVYGGGLVVIAGLVWFIYWMAKRQGRDEAKLDAAKKGLDHAKEAIEIDDRVRRLSDDERRRWLHGQQ